MVATLDGEAGDDRFRGAEIDRLEEMFAAPSVETVPTIARFMMVDTRVGPGDIAIVPSGKQNTLASLMGRISTRKVGLQSKN